MLKLLSFPGKRGDINIPKQVSTKYLIFGILLLNDETGAEVRTIATKHHEDAEQINLEILTLWIQGKGKPLSWERPKSWYLTPISWGMLILASLP